MKIAKVVGSNSHIDYVARVIDDLDSEYPPTAEDYGFGQFVSIDAGEQAIGIIYNSTLVNPEYASFGPRLSPRPMVENFSPDIINEQGVLLGIVLIGTMTPSGECMQSVPRSVVPAGCDLIKMAADKVMDFHRSDRGVLRLNYYPQLMTHTGTFFAPLLSSIIDQLYESCDAADKVRLAVIRNSINWQSTFGAGRT